MSDTHIGSATLSHSPLHEDLKDGEFFPGANRELILTHTIEALHRDASLIIWSGEKGSGKSTLCKMLEHRSSSICSVVAFPTTVDSFEDVIRTLVAHLGIDLSVEISRKSVGECQREIIQHLLDNAVRLLIIFDEAENIYLATLERIRKFIDRCAEKGVNIHVVFSGRPAFLENCEQLSICDFQYTREFILRLEPLSLEEAGEYLRSFTGSPGTADPGEVFHDKVIAEIHRLTGGNFKQISVFCKEALQASRDHGLLEELPHKVAYQGGRQPENSGLVSLSRNIKNSVLLPWLGAAGLTVLALLYFTNFISEERVDKPVVLKEQLVDKVEEEKNVRSVEPAQEPVPENRPVVAETKAEQKNSAVTETAAEESRQGVIVAEAPEEKQPEAEPAVKQVPAIVDGGIDRQTVALAPEEKQPEGEPAVERVPAIADRGIDRQTVASAPEEKQSEGETAAERVPAIVDGGIDKKTVASVPEEKQPEGEPAVERVQVIVGGGMDAVTNVSTPEDNQPGEKAGTEKVTEREVAGELVKIPDNSGTMALSSVAGDFPLPPETIEAPAVETVPVGENRNNTVSGTVAESTTAEPVKKLTQPLGKKILEPVKEKIVVERSAIIELYPSGNTKRNPNVEQLQLTESKQKKQVDETGVDKGTDGPPAVEELYKERLSAGESWRGGRKDGKFTVQLMVLTSRTAENNLKTMLLEDTYRQEAGNFFIFKNNSQLETIFVFYGEYPTMTQARQAQNSLPLFLKEHKPYALSIKGALTKVSR